MGVEGEWDLAVRRTYGEDTLASLVEMRRTVEVEMEPGEVVFFEVVLHFRVELLAGR